MKNRSNLIFDSVLVVNFCNNNDLDDYKFHLQTFRIDRNTTFKNLRNTIYKFWQFFEDEEFFGLYILENNHLTEIINNEELENQTSINAFLKNRSNLQKAQFFYFHNSKKSNIYNL